MKGRGCLLKLQTRCSALDGAQRLVDEALFIVYTLKTLVSFFKGF